MSSAADLPLYGYVFGTIKLTLLHAVIGLPPEAWWLPMIVMGILACAAIVDAFSSVVPDALVFLGLIAVIGAQTVYISWEYSARHLTMAMGAGLIVWLINYLWRRGFKVDALGMGDAKWTALAVSCFDFPPVLIAWGAGAWLALIWLGMLRLCHYQTTRIYFTPFLFLGLLYGIYYFRAH